VLCNNTSGSATPIACSIGQMQTLLSIPAVPLTATSGALGGSLLVVGVPVTTTVSVTGATTSQGCTAAPSAGNALIAGTTVDCYVSSANTVTLRLTGIAAVTPASQTYKVTVQ
jgi:hypothetical protein